MRVRSLACAKETLFNAPWSLIILFFARPLPTFGKSKAILAGLFSVKPAGGFASAAIATGSLKAGLWGAVSAAAFWGIGTAFKGIADVSKLGKANQLGQAVQSGLSKNIWRVKTSE